MAIDAVNTRFCVQATWSDSPHLSEAQKSALYRSIPPHQREARSKGIPQLGSGVIYPVAEEEIIIKPFKMPNYWPRCYGMDVGWNRTAAVFGAHDTDQDVIYLYSEHYRGQAEPAIHAQSIMARGRWIPGAIDPAANGRSQIDGTRLMDKYIELGLSLAAADNAVEAGIQEVWSRLSEGRLKVFDTLPNWLTEFRLYRRDEKGKVVKENDHLCDCTRYLCMTGIHVAEIAPRVREEYDSEMGSVTRNESTGY